MSNFWGAYHSMVQAVFYVWKQDVYSAKGIYTYKRVKKETALLLKANKSLSDEGSQKKKLRLNSKTKKSPVIRDRQMKKAKVGIYLTN